VILLARVEVEVFLLAPALPILLKMILFGGFFCGREPALLVILRVIIVTMIAGLMDDTDTDSRIGKLTTFPHRTAKAKCSLPTISGCASCGDDESS
jgi:hypothetical protein